MKGVRVHRAGLHLADLKGKHIVPDHAAALCSIRYKIREKSISPEEAQAYISGAVIPGNENGWILLNYKGLRLGWGKGSAGAIKNHYPKGLRKEKILI